jgi:hypothetical protein
VRTLRGLSCHLRSACRSEEAGAGGGRSILRGAAGRWPQGWQLVEARGRSSGESPDQVSRWTTLEGKNPREQPAIGELTPVRSSGTPGRVKAQKPRPVGPALCFGDGNTGG